jgi:S1-C subfamily serine protease
MERDGFAAEAGLREGDVLKAWNQTPLSFISQIQQALTEIKPGEAPVLSFERGGILRELPLRF